MSERERREAGLSAQEQERARAAREAEGRPTVPQARTSTEAVERRAEAMPGVAMLGRGWQTFAGTTLLVLAGFQLIWGLAGLLRRAMFLVPYTGLGITWDYPVWSWLTIGLAALLALTGCALLAGMTVARYAGIVIVAVLAFVNFLTLPAQPLWSFLMIGIDILAIYALTARGAEMAASRESSRHGAGGRAGV